jgi:hypothetical protein
MAENKPQIEYSILKEKILVNLKIQGTLSYDLLKEICECSRRDFAITMRQLLRNESIGRVRGMNSYRILKAI